MAGQVSKEGLGSVLMQAMLAAKHTRPQLRRLLHLRRRLQQRDDEDDAGRLGDLAHNLFHVYTVGLEAGCRSLATCLKLASKNGARLAFNTAVAVIPEEQLYDVLLAEPLPARPTTLTEALSRVEAAFNAVKLAQDHHIPRCIELIIGERPPSVTGEPPRVSSMLGYYDDPVAAAAEHIAKNGLPGLTPAAVATRKAAGKAPQAASSVDLDQALTYLHRAFTLASLAIKHTDLAVAAISSFVDPEEVASLTDFTSRVAYFSEDGRVTSDSPASQ